MVAPVPKEITEEGLAADLRYVMGTIDCHLVLNAVVQAGPGIRTLELGCGSGKLSYWYALRKATVHMVDVDPSAITYAGLLGLRIQSEVPDGTIGTIAFTTASLFEIDLQPEYDLVFNEGVPHHFQDERRQQVFDIMAAAAKPGGSVCVIGSSAYNEQTVKMAEETEHTYPGMPPKQKPFDSMELLDCLEASGLEECRVVPVTAFAQLAHIANQAKDDNFFKKDFPYNESEWQHSPLIAGWGRKPL